MSANIRDPDPFRPQHPRGPNVVPSDPGPVPGRLTQSSSPEPGTDEPCYRSVDPAKFSSSVTRSPGNQVALATFPSQKSRQAGKRSRDRTVTSGLTASARAYKKCYLPAIFCGFQAEQ